MLIREKKRKAAEILQDEIEEMDRRRRMKKLKDEREELKLKIEQEQLYDELELKKHKRYKTNVRERASDLTIQDRGFDSERGHAYVKPRRREDHVRTLEYDEYGRRDSNSSLLPPLDLAKYQREKLVPDHGQRRPVNSHRPIA
jgi:hypothetical protein